MSRTGILEYRLPNGQTRKELRLPEDVFHEDSLASLKGAPATHFHPGMVTAKNFRDVAVGYMGDDVRQDGDKVVGHMAIQDAVMVQKVHGGVLKELSAGYTCSLDETPGEWNGQRYDAVQKEIRYNHVALLPPGAGRSGAEVSLRLDSAGDCIAPEAWSQTDMKIEIIDGTEYEVGTDAHAKASKEREDSKAAAAKHLSEVTLRADAAEAEAEALKARLDGEEARVVEGVKSRLSLHRKALEAGVEVKEDSADSEIRKAVISKVLGLDVDEKGEAYEAAAFDLAMSKLGEADLAGLRKDAKDGSEHTDEGDKPEIPKGEQARLDMIERNAKAWRQGHVTK